MESKSPIAQILVIRGCRLGIISMRRSFVGLTDSDLIQLTPSKSVPQNFIKERAMTNLLVALSSMYEKSLANKKLHQMKRIFNLNMSKGAYVAQHLNDFNIITN